MKGLNIIGTERERECKIVYVFSRVRRLQGVIRVYVVNYPNIISR